MHGGIIHKTVTFSLLIIQISIIEEKVTVLIQTKPFNLASLTFIYLWEINAVKIHTIAGRQAAPAV